MIPYLNSKEYIGIIIFSLVYCLTLFGLGCYIGSDPTIPVGSKWEMVINKDNPFNEEIIVEFKVLDVKDGWVLYERYRHGNAITDTTRTNNWDWAKACVSGC